MKTLTKAEVRYILEDEFPLTVFAVGGTDALVHIRVQDEKYLKDVRDLFQNYSNIDIRFIGKVVAF